MGHGDRLRCVHVIPTNLGKVSNISRRVRSSPDVGSPIVCGDGRTRNWGSATANALFVVLITKNSRPSDRGAEQKPAREEGTLERV